MITSNGSRHIKRFMSGSQPSIAQSIALGVGTSAETSASTSLDFEVIRANIRLTSYDFINDRIIFKATLPDDFRGTVYEVGLWSRDADETAGAYGSRVVASFDTTEAWSGTFADATTNGGRAGATILLHSPAASASTTSSLTDVSYDFSGNSSADQFAFAFNVANANTSSLRFRFLTDASNYYDFNLGAQTAGYKIVKATKGSATVTGTPAWGSITQIQVTTTSGAGGASAVSFDGIRVEDSDSNSPDYVLVARELLGTPFVKTETMSQDAEFSLAVNIT